MGQSGQHGLQRKAIEHPLELETRPTGAQPADRRLSRQRSLQAAGLNVANPHPVGVPFVVRGHAQRLGPRALDNQVS